MKKTILHVGCGGAMLPAFMQHCAEVRLDIDPSCNPDIVCSMTEIPDGIGPFDAVFSSHCLEHLYPYEVVPCLEGFRRVTKPGGVVVIYVPDLEDVRATDELLYHSSCGPLTGLDLIYGLGTDLKANPFMAHHCGFVRSTLRGVMEAAGLKNVTVLRLHGEYEYNLFATGEA